MLRFVNICLLLGLLALAYVIYQVKYETRALDAEIATIGKEIEAERDGIAVLRAEWSLLNRPERIERLAKKHLKLAPRTAISTASRLRRKPLSRLMRSKLPRSKLPRSRLRRGKPPPNRPP